MSTIFEQQIFTNGATTDFSISRVPPGYVFCLDDALELKLLRESFMALETHLTASGEHSLSDILCEDELFEMLDYIPIWRSLVPGTFSHTHSKECALPAKKCISGFKVSESISEFKYLNYGDFFFLANDFSFDCPYVAINNEHLAVNVFTGEWAVMSPNANVRTFTPELTFEAAPDFVVLPYINEILNNNKI